MIFNALLLYNSKIIYFEFDSNPLIFTFIDTDEKIQKFSIFIDGNPLRVFEEQFL